MRRSPSALLSLSNLTRFKLPPCKLSTLILLCILIFSTLSFAAAPDRVTGSIDSSQTVALAKSLHPRAQAQYDLGPVDPSRQLSYITLLMSPSASQQKVLEQLLAQQQDRTSPNYHKWLTPQQYADRFGLSPNDLNKITTWLMSQGFQILSVGGGRNAVIFSGSAAQAQRAFGTQIHSYKVNGEEHFANSTPLMIPAALKGVVTSVMGLHDFRPQPANRGRRFGGMRNVRPDYYDGKYIFPNFLAPGDIATIYDITPLYTASIDGTGQKLAVVGQTDIILADINDFRSGFGLSTIPTSGTGACTTNSSGIVVSPCNTINFQYVLVGTDPGSISPNDIGEADLDVEWSGAVARNAQIVYVNAPATAGGVFDALSAAINPPSGPPLAPVVSMSYFEGCEAQATLDLETLLQQGNAEGVTIVNSSGDAGAAACDSNPPNNAINPPFSPAVGGLGVSYPASSPEVTGVGGTAISLADDSFPSPSSFWSTTLGTNGGTAQSYIPELAWNDDEELADYCHSPATGDTFCSQGGSPAVTGWVNLTSTATTQATAAQVQMDIWINSGGGGASNCATKTNAGVCQAGFAQPAWQRGLSVPNAPSGVRYVPDISLLASPNFPGYIFCTPQNPGGTPPVETSTCAVSIFDAVNRFLSIIGGSSVSTPVFAGIVTLLNQFLAGPASPGLGNINPMLYTLAAGSSTPFNQVKTGNNLVYCKPGTPSSQPASIQCPAEGVFGYQASDVDTNRTTGYNLVTGLGSVDVNKLAQAWASSPTPNFTLTATTATLSTTQGGTAGPDTITVTSTNGFVTNGQTAEALTYSCSGLPSESSCIFSPPSPTTSATVAVSITTTAPTAQLHAPLGRGNQIFYAMLLPGLVGIVLTLGSRKRAARGVRLLSLIVVLGLSTMWLAACGGGGGGGMSNPGTAKGTYTITINATTGTVRGTAATVSLTVN